MEKLIYTKTSNTKYLLNSKSADQYRKLKRAYGESNAFSLFAEPQADSNGEATALGDLSKEMQTRAKSIYAAQVQRLFALMKEYQSQEAEETLKLCLEIPDENTDIFLVNSPEGDKVVISRWGHIFDNVLPGDGSIWTFLDFDKYTMEFTILYEDNTPVSNSEWFFEYFV